MYYIIHIKETKTKMFYFGCIFTDTLLKTNNLRLNLSVYQICCSILPREHGKGVYQNYTGH